MIIPNPFQFLIFLVKVVPQFKHLNRFEGSSLMNFGKKRMVLNSLSENIYDYELLRYCTKINTSIIGGASKLFNYF
jgi:hypothetical protein